MVFTLFTGLMWTSGLMLTEAVFTLSIALMQSLETILIL